MSSILKALQKLESETLEKGTGQSWLHHFTARQKSPEKQGRFRDKYLLTLLCVGLIISGSTALIFIKTKPASLTSESQPVQGTENLTKNNAPAHTGRFADKAPGATGTDKITVKSSRPPEIGITNKEDVPIKQTARDGINEGGVRESAPADEPVVFRDTKKSGNAYSEKPSGPAAKVVEDVSAAGHKKLTPLPEPLETSGTSLQPGAVESPDTALNANQEESGLNTGIEPVNEPPDAIVAERIQNPDIKLHAISWTPDVKTRIAVINGSIVREDDTISSYQVYKINKDDIVLSKSGEFWRLAFRGR